MVDYLHAHYENIHANYCIWTTNFEIHCVSVSGEISCLHRRTIRMFPTAGTTVSSFLHSVQTGSGAHTASCPIGTKGSIPGGKTAGAWSWPLTSI
jgi:hypothetical protein